MFMPAELMDGRKTAEKLRAKVKKEIEFLKIKPVFAVVLVGDNSASLVYVKAKEKACKEAGIEVRKLEFPESVSEKELLKKIEELNEDPEVDGILVQLPLPEQIGREKIMDAVAPEKDVDGFHPVNQKKVLEGDESLAPCTPKGVIKLLEEYNVEVKGKNCVVVGTSKIVGKPLGVMLENRGGKVTYCDKSTKDLKAETLKADILAVAVGKPGLISGDMVKEGTVVVDIGTTKVEGKLKGDVDFEKVKEKASLITPVPGGVGPMTVAGVTENVLIAVKKQKG